VLHKIRWTPQKIAQRIRLIEPLVYRRKHPFPPFRYLNLAGPMDTPPTAADTDDSAWEEVHPNSYWSAWMTNFVLRTSFRVPDDWDADAPVSLFLPIGEAGDFSHPEVLAYIDGQAYAGADRHHQEVRLGDAHRDGRDHQLTLHGWLGGMWHQNDNTRPYMGECAVVQVDQPTRDFIATARVALGVTKMLDADEPALGKILDALDAAFLQLDTRDPLGDAFYASVPQAHAVLREGLQKAGAPSDVSLMATGHAHIDVAWLWTLGQTRRKAGRTFHTALRLMDEFPEYHFTQSQPQLYDYVRQDYPELLEAIKQRVAEGRWEPIGGMWIEADCNLSGAESLARQFLLGRSFFRKHFGPDAESPVLWLPDVFGYAWALPQLIKEAGLHYFFTIKIGWSQYNRLPYDTFWWQGLDGTRVLTHFSTSPGNDELAPLQPGLREQLMLALGYGRGFTSTYNASATAEEVIGTWRTFQQKEQQTDMLMAFGYGDGGGGPTREMLENLREMKSFPATPRVRQEHVGAFFKRLEEERGAILPTWNGELYLEFHRGTYTTQSRNKRANRTSEFRLHDAELLATIADLRDTNYTYPVEMLNRAWELVCLNQFHDIIPGSSIGEVYVESLQQYAEIAELAAQVQTTALKAIAASTSGDLLVCNPTSFNDQALAFWNGTLPEGTHLRADDNTVAWVQPTAGGAWLDVGAVQPMGLTALRVVDGSVGLPDTGLSVSPQHLENETVRIELNAAGDIVRIYDKYNLREVLPEGAIANQLLAFEDRPMNWDAWDVDIFYQDRHWLAEPAESISVVEAGPLRATLEIKRRILNSSFTQRLSINYFSPQLDIETVIDWKERHILLKAAFPVNILAPTATYEIQWGNVERPTHYNTSWDWARFETCAQKWVDLSEGDYGVSLLNDSKYGHDIHGNVIRISLLRGPTMPDPNADLGEQRFTYSLLPHPGRWDETTIGAAYHLNDPLIVFDTGRRGSHSEGVPSLIGVEQSNIVIETVKRAEDGNGLIVRLYEGQRRRGPITLSVGFELAEAWRVNIMEENQHAVDVDGEQVTYTIRPYEIVTLRLVPKA
jgi:alpha-mannosidase